MLSYARRFHIINKIRPTKISPTPPQNRGEMLPTLPGDSARAGAAGEDEDVPSDAEEPGSVAVSRVGAASFVAVGALTVAVAVARVVGVGDSVLGVLVGVTVWDAIVSVVGRGDGVTLLSPAGGVGADVG